MNRPAHRLLIALALIVVAILLFRPFARPSIKEIGLPMANVPSPSSTPSSAPISAPANSPRMTTSAPSDPQAGTGAQDPGEPAATGPRFYSGVPTAAQRTAAEADPALQSLSYALRDYRAALGQNPVGSNPEIARALLGENSRNAHFLRSELPINAQGELLDRWGTPYFFHQISRTEIDIYSAGPDRTLWTDDDEILR